MHADLGEAARITGAALDSTEKIARPRVRQHGWKVRLTGSSTRHRNSGTHGAATWESPPATWDEHGRWMAELFDRDPHARIAGYNGRDAFHHETADKYR
jgi:hypothetical protein